VRKTGFCHNKLVFTGLIQAQGMIQALGSDQLKINIAAAEGNSRLKELVIGDSVAVDGVCLTVEETFSQGFVASASPETLRRTTLSSVSKTGSYVNLEPSLQVGDKIGGHFVTGHVDGVGCLWESVATERSWQMTFGSLNQSKDNWDRTIGRYLISKGSIAVNGISLTIADCDPQCQWFQCAVIPLTYQETNLSRLQQGNGVNLESDILGKYVDKLVHYQSSFAPTDDISLSFLAEHGYL